MNPLPSYLQTQNITISLFGQWDTTRAPGFNRRKGLASFLIFAFGDIRIDPTWFCLDKEGEIFYYEFSK
jgi:hypothetical protein